MDVFSLGADDNVPPRIHYVIDKQCANELLLQDIHPSYNIPNDWIIINKEIKIMLPHKLKGCSNVSKNLDFT